jgi:hypothetical protein
MGAGKSWFMGGLSGKRRAGDLAEAEEGDGSAGVGQRLKCPGIVEARGRGVNRHASAGPGDLD